MDELKLEIKNISNILGGKGGGGRKDLAQGGGEDVSKLDKYLEYIENKLIMISSKSMKISHIKVTRNSNCINNTNKF